MQYGIGHAFVLLLVATLFMAAAALIQAKADWPFRNQSRQRFRKLK